MITHNQLKYLQSSGLQPSQIAQVVRYAGGYDRTTAPKTAGGFMGNVVTSGIRAVGDLGGAVVNTVNPNMEKNTLANMMRLGQGIGQKLDPTKGNKIANASNKLTSYVFPMLAPFLNPNNINYEPQAEAVGDFYKQRYGGVNNILNTAYNDPVGMALDVATVASGVGGALKGGATAATKAGISAGKLAEAGNAFTKAASFTDPFSLMGKGVGRVTSGSRSRIASGLEKAGENIVTRGIGNPAAQAKAAQKGGRSVSSFIDEYNLWDRSPESAAAAKKGIINQYDDLAMNSGKSVQMAQIIKSFNDEIARLQGGMNGVVSDANQAKIIELIRRRDQLIQAAGGMVDEGGQLISSPVSAGVDTLTNFRRNVIDPDVPQSMFNLDARGSGSAQGVKQARDFVKAGIDSTDPRLAKLGRDYGMAKSVEKIFEQSAARGNNRQMVNFTKLGSAGLGSVVAGFPGAVAGFATEQIVNSPQGIRILSKGLKSGSKVIGSNRLNQFNAKMGRVITPGYSYAKIGRITNQTGKLSQPKPLPPKQGVSQTQPSTPQQSTLTSTQNAYTPTPKIPDIKLPKKTKYSQAFSGNVKLQRGSFY